jgi:chaperonin GroEL
MTKYSEFLFRDEARAKLLRGTNVLADAVRGTLGPHVRAVLIERAYGTPLVCDDGVTIVKQVHLKDPAENLGAQMLRGAAVQTNEAVGDGTTTSTLLAHAMFAEGLRQVTFGVNAIDVRAGMINATKSAIDALRAMSRPVKDRADTAHIATVSAHNDAAVGALVAEAVERVGPEGVVEVEEARGTETTLELVEGMQFDLRDRLRIDGGRS